jgi:hypothetical protein
VLFRDIESGDYLIARQSPRAEVPYELLHEGDHVELIDGRTVPVKRKKRCSRAELQIFCE